MNFLTEKLTALLALLPKKQADRAAFPLSITPMPEPLDEDGNTPFLLAASKLDLPLMEKLARQGADISKANFKGMTAAHWCALSPDRLQWLKEIGAPLDRVAKDGRTPIMMATGIRKGAPVAVLAEHPDVDTNRLDEDGHTILHKFLRWIDHSSTMNIPPAGPDALIAALLKNGADICHEYEVLKHARRLLPRSHYSEMKAGIRVTTWEETCRRKHLAPGRIFVCEDFLNEDGSLTLTAKQLAGSGALTEAFTPERWRGREAEGLSVHAAMLPRLPGFQKARYELSIDLTPLVHAARPAQAMTFVKRTEHLPNRQR